MFRVLLTLIFIRPFISLLALSYLFVLDANAGQVGLERLKFILRRINPRVVGVTAMAFTYKQVNPDIFTVIGGIHPTNLPE